MPYRHILNLFSVTILGLFVGYASTHVLLETNKNEILRETINRKISSVESLTETKYTLSKLGSEQVYQDYFDVRIKHEKITNEESTVKAIITAKQDLPAGFNFKWILGQDVQATSSLSAGILNEIKKGDQSEIYLNVYGFNKKQKTFLSFEISGVVNGQKIFKETLSSSMPEDSFEYLVQQKYEDEMKLIEKNQKSSGKIFGQSAEKSFSMKKFDLENIIK